MKIKAKDAYVETPRYVCNSCGDPNCQWIVTKDYYADRAAKDKAAGKESYYTEDNTRVGVGSRHQDVAVDMPYRWRTLSDDGDKSYEGYCSEQCLAPLDDLGMADVGDTTIAFYDKAEKKWKVAN